MTTTDRPEPKGFFDRIATTVPAAAFSARCGASSGPRLGKPSSRQDLVTAGGLVESLGPRWEGLAGEPAPRRLALALLASQVLHGRRTTLRRIEEAVAVLADAREAELRRDAERLLRSVVGGDMDDARDVGLASACEACLDRVMGEAPGLAGCVASLAAPHAYGATVMIAALRAAKRADGILPDSHFLWLRPSDPLGWALVTDHGRLSRFAAAVAANVHFAREVEAGRPLPEPDMREAARLMARRAA